MVFCPISEAKKLLQPSPSNSNTDGVFFNYDKEGINGIRRNGEDIGDVSRGNTKVFNHSKPHELEEKLRSAQSHLSAFGGMDGKAMIFSPEGDGMWCTILSSRSRTRVTLLIPIDGPVELWIGNIKQRLMDTDNHTCQLTTNGKFVQVNKIDNNKFFVSFNKGDDGCIHDFD